MNCDVEASLFDHKLAQKIADIQLFRERLSEKVHSTIPKGIVGGFEFTVLQTEFERNGTKGHENVFASAKGKQQK